MAVYIHQRKEWPVFSWKQEVIGPQLTEVVHHQGRLLGRMEALGPDLQAEAALRTLTLDILQSCEIDGVILDPGLVRSSVARRLGLEIDGGASAGWEVEGMVEMMLDAVQGYDALLTEDRLFGWHAAMFPGGRSGIHRNVVGNSNVLAAEMRRFLDWFNRDNSPHPVIKAAIAHFCFVKIRPFDDGNGRIARAIMDMQLSRADRSDSRFYSMSTQIWVEKDAYFGLLEKTHKGSSDITAWLSWFLHCLHQAILNTNTTLEAVMTKARFWKRNAGESFNERQRLILNKLLDDFDGKLTSSGWAEMARTSQDSASRDIADLMKKGILVKAAGGGRSTSYAIVTT